MVKELIKRQIRKTGTYRVLEKRIKSLNRDNQKFSKENKNLKEKLKKKNENILKYKKYSQLLINNLNMEIRSAKSNFVDYDELNEDTDWNNLTIIIPYRKDDEVREVNLDITLKYLSNIGISNLIISEHSDLSSDELLREMYQHLFKNYKYIWNYANGKLFNRSLAINRGVVSSSTPYFAFFDVDCLTKKKNINIAVNLLDQGFDVIFPFNRQVSDIVDKVAFTDEYDFNIVKSPVEKRLWADGGIVFWNKKSFIEIGMYNEYFSGWGGEDNELMYRAGLFELENFRIDDILYHLYHDRPQIRNENNNNQEDIIRKLTTKEKCKEVISKWPWIVKLNESIDADKIKISVIVPVYNEDNYLKQCLNSIIHQTLREIEIICIDDGSTDNSPSILDEYALKDDRIIVIHKENEGPSTARKVGLKIAKGEYISVIDSDDWFELDTLENVYNNAISNESDVVLLNIKKYDDSKKTFIESKIYDLSGYFKDPNIDFNDFNFNYTNFKPYVLNKYFSAAKIYKTEFLKKYDDFYFPKERIFFEDVPLHVQILLRADKISYCKEVAFNYRFNKPYSMSGNPNRNIFDIIIQINKVEKILLGMDKMDEFKEEFDKFTFKQLYQWLIKCDRIYQEEFFQETKKYFQRFDLTNNKLSDQRSKNIHKFIKESKDMDEFQHKMSEM